VMIGRQHFNEVVLADFEYSQLPGDRPSPICLAARELVRGPTHRLFGEELLARSVPPYPTGPDSLFVAYYASAEVGCHLALGWPVPRYILDLFAEFRCATNGRRLTCGNGLIGALIYYGLTAMGAVEKGEMRQLAIRGGPYTADESRRLIEYCEEDVNATVRLFNAMLPSFNI
jgi:DNA polymerase-1